MNLLRQPVAPPRHGRSTMFALLLIAGQHPEHVQRLELAIDRGSWSFEASPDVTGLRSGVRGEIIKDREPQGRHRVPGASDRETESLAAVHPDRQLKPDQRYVTCVPFVPLKAAAGAFGDPQRVDEGDVEWVEVDGRRVKPGMFVAQVVGKSMEPDIPDGAYCLFSAPVAGSRQGRTVLVQLRRSP